MSKPSNRDQEVTAAPSSSCLMAPHLSVSKQDWGNSCSTWNASHSTHFLASSPTHGFTHQATQSDGLCSALTPPQVTEVFFTCHSTRKQAHFPKLTCTHAHGKSGTSHGGHNLWCKHLFAGFCFFSTCEMEKANILARSHIQLPRESHGRPGVGRGLGVNALRLTCFVAAGLGVRGVSGSSSRRRWWRCTGAGLARLRRPHTRSRWPTRSSVLQFPETKQQQLFLCCLSVPAFLAHCNGSSSSGGEAEGCRLWSHSLLSLTRSFPPSLPACVCVCVSSPSNRARGNYVCKKKKMQKCSEMKWASYLVIKVCLFMVPVLLCQQQCTWANEPW